MAAVSGRCGSLPGMAPTDRRTDRHDAPALSRAAGPYGPEVDDLSADPSSDRFGADERRPPGRLERAASWLRATPAELAGLAILLVGAVVASLLLWSGATGRPAVLQAHGGDGSAAAAGQPAVTREDPRTSGPGATGDPGHAATDAADPGHAAPDAQTAGGPPPTPTGGPPPAPEPPGPLTVHVSGAVQRPGLVELPAGSRIGHAIEAAGGLGPGADLATVNLARPLLDGEQVHVLREGEVAPAPATPDPSAAGEGGPVADPAGAGGGGIDAEGRVDLNRATAAELETLPGIGPAKAAAIVEHRETQGPFAEPGDIRAVAGIGEKTFQQLADRITAG